jgi:hypothetical protein
MNVFPNPDEDYHFALLNVPIVWWRKPYGGLNGYGASPQRRCE